MTRFNVQKLKTKRDFVIFAVATLNCRDLAKKVTPVTKLWFLPFLCSVRDYLTGFHKRKVERRKAAVAEIRKKIREEQIRVREEVSVK